MGMNIADFETIDPAIAPALGSEGIYDTDQLLAEAGSRSGRAALAGRTGIAADALIKLVHWSDLMRLPKLVEGYCVLFDAIDMGSWTKLASANAPELLRALRRTNVELTAVRSIQPESILASWIDQAASQSSAVEP